MAAEESKARHPPALNVYAQQASQDNASLRLEAQLQQQINALTRQSNRGRAIAVRRREESNRRIELSKETKPDGWRRTMRHNRDAAWERWLGRERQLHSRILALHHQISALRPPRTEVKGEDQDLGGGGRRRRRKSRRKKRRRRKTRRRPGKRKRRRRRTRR